MLGYGLLLLILIAPSVYGAAKYHRSFEQTLGPSVAAEILLLYLLGLVGLLRFAVPVMLLVAAGCLLCALPLIIRNPREFARAFCTPAMVVFFCFAPLCYLGNIDRFSIFHDEFIHWQSVVKLMDSAKSLYGHPDVAPFALYTYYPGVSLMEYLGVQLMGLRDGAMYVSFQVLWMALLLGGMQGTSWRRPLRALGGALLLFFCYTLFFPFAMLRLVVDPIMGLLVALLFYALLFPDESPRFDAVRFGLLLFLLAFSKNDANLLWVLSLVLCRWVLQRGRPRWRWQWLCCGLLVLVPMASWKLYVWRSGIVEFFPAQTLSNLQALTAGTLDAAHSSVPGRFLDWFIHTSYRHNEIYVAYAIPTTSLVLCLVLVAVSVLTAWVCPRTDRRRLRTWLLWLWGTGICYLLGVVLMYTLALQTWEAETLNDMARYVTTVWLFLGLALCMVVLRWAQEKNIRAQGAAAGLLALSVVFGNRDLVLGTYGTRETVTLTAWQQENRIHYVQFLQQHVPAGSRLRIWGSTGESLYYAWRYHLVPEIELLPYGGHWEDAGMDRSVQALRASLAETDYVYVALRAQDQPEFALDARYASLFEGGADAIREHALYRVVPGAQGEPILSLVEVYTPPSE